MAKILLIVSGGIAAYKAPDLVRTFVKRGHDVRVVMTDAASAFTTELSLAVVSGHPVRHSLLDASEEGSVGHIELADWPDLVVVAPATANRMAKAALGLADDLASTVLLATRAPVLWAPAMNTNMWTHPATRRNLATLAEEGAHFCGPDRGDLACGWVGAGRMMDPPVIADAADAIVSPVAAGDWSGKRVVVSAGPTLAYMDPVRFMSNASTGAMGVAIAVAARDAGAEVTLVAGPLRVPPPAAIDRHDIETAPEMLAALDQALGGADLLAMVAAVADFAPENPAAAKLPKTAARETLAGLRWRNESDLLATLARAHPEVTCLGFAAQTLEGDEEVTERLTALGRAKLATKGIGAVFANRVGVPGTGFGSPTNGGVLVLANGPNLDAGPPRPKPELARWILGHVRELVG
jgi:phosphopantothenoylcysteine decarboxylase/phosphopantothenate--cysteine ligase